MAETQCLNQSFNFLTDKLSWASSTVLHECGGTAVIQTYPSAVLN